MPSITRHCHRCNTEFTVAQQSSRKTFCSSTCRSRNSRNPAKAEAPAVPAGSLGTLAASVELKLSATGRPFDDPLSVYLQHLATLLDNPADLAGSVLSSVGREFRATYAVVTRDLDDDEPDATDIARAAIAAKRADMYRRRMEAEEAR